MSDDQAQAVEAWPIQCETCGRRFLIFPDDPNEPTIYDAESGNSEPGAIQCECGAELWVEAEPGGWRPWQLVTIGGRSHLSGPAAAARRPGWVILLLIRLLDWLLNWANSRK